ncbi:MAG: transcriptional regulator, partial [Crenarchaeota archaeon]|nr:transcriptional regulator [Thermoproteota archaeon]
PPPKPIEEIEKELEEELKKLEAEIKKNEEKTQTPTSGAEENKQ